ncbi:MAG TPA: V-type ATP synthase subunit I, partial [Clostridia bacterium]|nr:V-type ATP synthase subunit I [Clostridia bacterium]
MAIVKMSRFSLFAFDSDRDDLLRELQNFGYVHFVNLDEDEALKEEGLVNVEVPESIVEIEEEIAKVKYSIDLLSRYHTPENGLKSMLKGKDSYTFQELQEKAAKIDYVPIYNKLKELAQKLEKINQEELHLKSLKEEFKPWKTFNYPISGLKKFAQSEVFIGAIPKKLKDKFTEDLTDLTYTYLEIVSEDQGNVYLFALTSKDETEKLNEILRNNSFSHIKLSGEAEPEQEIAKIDTALEELEKEKKAIRDSIKSLADNLPDLEVYYEYLMNNKLRVAAAENFLRTDRINVIKGYIPTDREADFRKAVEASQKNAYYLEIAEADKDDPQVPILLKNSRFARAFESITTMYGLPKYNEIDPTPLLAPFYLFFFGMMVADLGYGLIMLVGTLIALKVAN